MLSSTSLFHSLNKGISVKSKVGKQFVELARLTKPVTNANQFNGAWELLSSKFAYSRAQATVDRMFLCYYCTASLLQRSKNGFGIERLYAESINDLSGNALFSKSISGFHCLSDFYATGDDGDIGSFAKYVGTTNLELNIGSIYCWNSSTSHSDINRTRGFCGQTNCGTASSIVGRN